MTALRIVAAVLFLGMGILTLLNLTKEAT
jgi:hypothetical protein